MGQIKTALISRLTALFHELSFALTPKDYEKLLNAFNTIMALTTQGSLPDLPYKLFQLTYSPDPFTRLVASGALSIHFEVGKRHPVHDLIQALERAARSFEGNRDYFYAYISALATESPDLPSLIRRLNDDLPSLPDNMRFALTNVVVKCALDLT